MSRIRLTWEVHFLRIQFGLALLTGIGLFAWYRWFNGWNDIHAILTGNRAAVYGALASIWGSLLGFTITAVSIVLGFAASERMAIMRSSDHYETLWRVFTLAIRVLGLATVAALIGLVYDRDSAPHPWALLLCAVTTVLAIMHLMNCVWVLEQVVRIVTAPSKARPGDET
jgi:hypothetical protein